MTSEVVRGNRRRNHEPTIGSLSASDLASDKRTGKELYEASQHVDRPLPPETAANFVQAFESRGFAYRFADTSLIKLLDTRRLTGRHVGMQPRWYRCEREHSAIDEYGSACADAPQE
jgi:hypothetical protein